MTSPCNNVGIFKIVNPFSLSRYIGSFYDKFGEAVTSGIVNMEL